MDKWVIFIGGHTKLIFTFLSIIFQTATSIGKNKKPTADNIAEILFMTASWLMGVFVFAILIGDIRDIVGNARRNALSFQRHLDAITTYMNNNKVAKPVQVCFLEKILIFSNILFHAIKHQVYHLA